MWWNRVGDELLEDINKLLEINQLQAEELSNKIEQGVDSVQEKLVSEDNIKAEEKQKNLEIIQQSKCETLELVMVLKLQKMQKLDEAIEKIKLLKEQYSIQEIPTKHSLGTETSYHKFKLFLSDASNFNSDNLYKDFEKLLTGDIAHLPEDSGI